jgi:hypothetical protein
MPELCKYKGMKIEMLYNEHNPPHFHVYYAGEYASFNLEGEIIAGKLKPKQVKNVKNFIKEHKKELEENWKLSSEGKPLCKIKLQKQVS